MEATLRQRFGCVHSSQHGDGLEVLARILGNCDQLLRDRGCTSVTRADDLMAAMEEGKAVLRGRGAAVPIDIYVATDERVSVKFARHALDSRKRDDGWAIVVSVEGPTPFTKRECEGKPVQFLLARDIYVNVTRHALVPKHESMPGPPDGVDVANLPRILENDPVVQWYNWPVGTVVRVWRVFGGHEPIPYFRVVSVVS